MATTTGTVAVNAAFLQEIKQDNHELRATLASLAPVADGNPLFLDARQIVEGFARLRDQLAVHFALEESYGYFDEALSFNPRLSHQADVLRHQHSGLYLEICQLVERAEQCLYHEPGSTSLRQLANEFGSFHGRFQQHERQENSLILEAFDEEIGAGD